jgi:uncharacterized protein YndB with AHSA1/START domain
MEATRLVEKPSLTLTREYAAPPEKVWRAWTEPQALKQWWTDSPGGKVSVAELDVRVGGRFRIVFGGPKGTDHEVAGTYLEVLPNRKLVFTWSWPRTTPERESQVTIVFRAVEGGPSGMSTELDFRHEQLFDEKVRDDHKRGWSGTLDKLAEYLAS